MIHATATPETAEKARTYARWMHRDAAGLLRAGGRAPLLICKEGRKDFYWVGRVANGWELLKEQPDADGEEQEPVQYIIDTSFGPNTEHWDCTCPDFEYRSYKRKVRACKHILGVAGALKHIGVKA